MKRKIFHYKLLLSAVLYLFSVSANAQSTPLNISNSLGWDGEPVLVVNPTNTRNIVVAWMSFQLPLRIGIECKASMDGGQSWSSTFFQPHFSSSWSSADPCMVFSNNGTLFLAYIDYRSNPDSGGVYVTRSMDGGLSWDAPSLAIDAQVSSKRPLDRPWIAIDNSAGASNGTLYLTTKPAPWIPAPNRPTYTVSTDAGHNWTPLRFADTTGFTSVIIQAPMISPAVGADGTLYMVYPAINGFTMQLVLAKSSDQGNTLQHSFITPVILTADTNPKQAWKFHVDPVQPGRLLLSWPEARNGDLDIYSVSSMDGGLSWTLPTRVNDDAISNGVMQDMIWNSISENGTQLIAWRDRRNAGGTGFFQPFDIYATYSNDGGQSYSGNIRVTPTITPFDTLLSLSGNDFLGLDIKGDSGHIAWADMSAGNLDVFHSSIDFSFLNNVPALKAGFRLVSDLSNSRYILQSTGGKILFQKLLDIRGRQIDLQGIVKDEKEIVLDLSALAPGIYFAQIELGGRGQSIRLVKP